MRTSALLLLFSFSLSAQIELSPQDESRIRAAIAEQARKDTNHRTEVWNERRPVVYRVRHIESLAADVAIAEADGFNSGTIFDGPYRYTFIMMRSGDAWTVRRKIPVCTQGPILQPLSGSPKCVVPGSSGCPD